MSQFVLIGVTGNVGRVAAQRLVSQGAKVRGIIRDQAKAAGLVEVGIDPEVAALDDAEALTRAFKDADGVYVMTPTWFESVDMFAENVRAVAAIGHALRATSPARTVLLSSLGARHPAGTGAILKLHHMEQSFADIPGVVSIRAGSFMENYAGLIPHVRETGVLPSMLAPLDRAHPTVATRDIGELVATILIDWSDDARTVDFEGPRRYAPNDVAAAFAEVLGRPVRAELLPPSEWAATYARWGLTPRSAEAMAEMMAGFNNGLIAFDAPEADTLHGPTPLETVLADLASR